VWPTMWVNAMSLSGTTVADDRSSTPAIDGGRRRVALGLLGLAGLSLIPSGAQRSLAAEGAEAISDAAFIKRTEHYFDDITTIRSQFIQTNPDGSYIDGTIMMRRPGHMRIDYGDESPIEVIANGTFFILVDHRLQEVSYIPLESTPAYLLLREDFTLGGEIIVSKLERGAGLVRLTLVRAGEADVGSVTVTLNAEPMQLRQWEIEDQQGQRTRVTLLDPRFGLTLPEDAFDFANPYSPANNQNDR